MTKQEYKEYQERVAETFRLNELENLTSGAYECPACNEVMDFDNDPVVCPDCGMNYELASEPYFTWRSCECCHSNLGAFLYPASGYSKTGVIYTFEICADCVYYNEYGRLDDMTMMDMA